nr:uncharacterized protein LOC109168401 [Ipomoea batatas]
MSSLRKMRPHEALRQKDVKFKKNEARRVRVVRRHNNICKWSIFGSKSNPNCPFTIKTYNHVHSCGNQDENKVVTSGFLAKFFKDEFIVNTDWGRGPFQEHVKAKFNCQLTRNQAYLAKKKDLKQIDGQDLEQFKLLNDYCEELMRSNPGTTVKMKLDSEFIIKGRPRFVKLYICFGACKEGFIRGYRPIIGLDECHLKGSQKGGQLLSAIGLDGDNSIFPVAFAIVEGHVLKMQFWAVCKANTEAEYHARMEELKTMNVKAFEWLSARDPKQDKPVQTMCEKIRIYLMTRMQKNRDKMRNYSSMVCPKILKLIEEGKDKCARFSAYKAVDDIYQVDDDNFKPFKVDLSIRKKGDLPELYVHHCYFVEQYLRAYGPAILPIRAEELWHKTYLPPPLPPKYKAQPGRQKKKRKIDPVVEKPDQTKLGKKGHNRTTCKGKGQEVQQPHSHVPQQPVSHQVEETHEVQGQFEDVVVETQVPDFVLNEMEGMSSQPSQAWWRQCNPNCFKFYFNCNNSCCC